MIISKNLPATANLQVDLEVIPIVTEQMEGDSIAQQMLAWLDDQAMSSCRENQEFGHHYMLAAHYYHDPYQSKLVLVERS